jgi:UDPglucose 6-dehydrogenase
VGWENGAEDYRNSEETVNMKNSNPVKISVLGSGYVGLVTGACLAKLGCRVTMIDIDRAKIDAINHQVSPIYEEGLDELLKEVDIEATSDYGKIIDSSVVFLCIGTPVNDEGNMSQEQLAQATGQLADVLRKRSDYCTVVVKSTVVPGTTEELVIPLLEKSGKKAGKDFGVCMSPEFLREGKAVFDFMNPMRLIIGELDEKSGDNLLGIYRSFKAPIMRTNLRTAEMVKLASNIFLATKISYMNEIGNICKKLGIDTYEVAKGMAYDERIGRQFLNAGIGYGGSCLPKDIRALIARAREAGYQPKILEEVFALNEAQALKPVELLKKHISLKGASIGLLGLAFKPETDDIRDSRATIIVPALLAEGAAVKAYDPMAVENFKKLFPNIEYVGVEDVMTCDAVIIVTEWEEFNNLDYRGNVVIDGRRVLKAREARIYEGVCW